MANKTKRPFKTGQLIQPKNSYVTRADNRIRLILKIRDIKTTCCGVCTHLRKYTFLNPDGTSDWEKWDLYEEEMYKVSSGKEE